MPVEGVFSPEDPSGPGQSHSVLADDGIALHVVEVGTGEPVLFIHEFAGDLQSWEAQFRHLSAGHRCIAYNARGYPPSDVPPEPERYSQERAVEDAIAVLDALQIPRAHVVGLSMGGFCALHLAMSHPDRVGSAVVAGCGYGADPESREAFQEECTAVAEAWRTLGCEVVAERYAVGPSRIQLQRKRPQTWQTFKSRLGCHSSLGMANTMLGVQRERPSLYELKDRLRGVPCPVLIINGDEDDGTLETGLMLKRTLPAAAMLVLPNTGHTCNLEEPDTFNETIERFLSDVEQGSWPEREPRRDAGGLMGLGTESAEAARAEA